MLQRKVQPFRGGWGIIMADNEICGSNADSAKSGDDTEYSEDFKEGLYPAILSIFVNLAFYFCNSYQVSKLQYFLCFTLPANCGMTMAFIMFPIKAYLRDNVPLNDWQFEQAKYVMKHSDKIHKRILACLFVILYKPLFFLLYWVIFSGAFLVTFYLAGRFSN